MANPTTLRGDTAKFWISSTTGTPTYGFHTQAILGIADISLTLDRGTVEAPLVGEKGNYFTAGALSAEGSFTASKLDTTSVGEVIRQMITGSKVRISGSCGTTGLNFYFKSAMITNFDLSIGDAETISEGSIDYIVMDPENVKRNTVGTSTIIQDTSVECLVIRRKIIWLMS